MFLRCFLCSSLVNLLLLASLKERSTYGVSDEGDLEEKLLADETTRDKFALFWETVARLEVKAFPYFRE